MITVNVNNGAAISLPTQTTSVVNVSAINNGVSVSQTPSIFINAASVGVAGPQGKTGPAGADGTDGVDGADGADGIGVPAGGSDFQVLRKASGTDYDTQWDYADRVTIEVRFIEAISKGDPVYVSGFNSGQNRVEVGKADASDSSKMPAIGLAFDDYSQNDNGQVATIGNLDNVNTQVSPNDFQEGEVLYVKSGGGLTNVKPTGTNLIQNVGKVGRRQQNNGQIVVMAIGRSNDIPNLPAGKIFIGSATNTEESAYTLPTADGSANQVLRTDGSGDVSFQSITEATGNELENVVEDTSPQLGGDLDVNGNDIVSKPGTNLPVNIIPDGTGPVNLGEWSLKSYTSLGAAQDGHVIAYDHSSGLLTPVAPAASKTFTISMGGRYTMGTPNRYYYYNGVYGWDFYDLSSNVSSFSNLSYLNWYSGIVIPYDATEAKVVGTIRTGNTEDYEVELWYASNPDGSTSSFSPTSIASQTFTGASGAAVKIDFSATGLSLSSTDVLFLTYYRSTGATTTTRVYVSMTIALS